MCQIIITLRAIGTKTDKVCGILIQQPRLPSSFQFAKEAIPNNQQNVTSHTSHKTIISKAYQQELTQTRLGQ